MPNFKRVKIKICLLGDPAVGKTSLIQKYIYNFFGDTYMRTIGTKVSRKVIKFKDQGTNIEYEVIMMIWDIMGQKFSSMPLDKYLKMSQGALIVCDITRRKTLKSLVDWTKTLYRETGEVPVIYLANKIDLENDKTITNSELDMLSKNEGVKYYTTSAKTGINVDKAFQKLGELIIKSSEKRKYETEKIEPSTGEIRTEVEKPELELKEGIIDESELIKTEPITATTSKVNEKETKIEPISDNKTQDFQIDEFEIKPGLGYIIKEEKPDRSFKLFRELIKRDIHGLCISRVHPKRIQDEFKIEGVPILWLSAESPNKEEIIVPTFLPQLNTIIIDFIQKYDKVIILLEGIEYLIDQNDFKAVLSLIHSLNDNIMGSNASLLIPLDPLIFNERELHMLTRDFKLI